MNNRKIKFSVQYPKGMALRERLHLAWAAIKFAWAFSSRTPEEQDRVMNFFAGQPGVTVTRTKADES